MTSQSLWAVKGIFARPRPWCLSWSKWISQKPCVQPWWEKCRFCPAESMTRQLTKTSRLQVLWRDQREWFLTPVTWVVNMPSDLLQNLFHQQHYKHNYQQWYLWVCFCSSIFPWKTSRCGFAGADRCGSRQSTCHHFRERGRTWAVFQGFTSRNECISTLQTTKMS